MRRALALLALTAIGCSPAAATPSWRPQDRRTRQILTAELGANSSFSNAKSCDLRGTTNHAYGSANWDYTDGATSLTIAYWVYLDPAGSATGEAPFGPDSASGPTWFAYQAGNSGNTTRMGWYLNNGVWDLSYTSYSINRGAWHHVISTFGSSASTHYIDGVDATVDSTKVSPLTTLAGADFYFGCRGNSSASDTCLTNSELDGVIDEAAIFGFEATGTQINELCCGSTASCGGSCKTHNLANVSFYDAQVIDWFRCGDGESDSSSIMVSEPSGYTVTWNSAITYSTSVLPPSE